MSTNDNKEMCCICSTLQEHNLYGEQHVWSNEDQDTRILTCNMCWSCKQRLIFREEEGAEGVRFIYRYGASKLTPCWFVKDKSNKWF